VRIGGTPLLSATLLIYFPSMLMSLGQGMIIPALPKLGEEFGVSGAMAIQVVTAQLIGRTIVLMPVGAMVDRWGAKTPMVIGAAVATLSALASAAAPNFIVLVVAQFMWGAAASSWSFGREIAAFQLVRREQRGRQMSALMGISSTGMAMGPAIGGVLTDLIGIRWLFVVYASALSLVLVISTLQPKPQIRIERKKAPILDIRAVREIHPHYRITYIILFIATFGQMIRGQVTNTMLPLYTQVELGYSATQSGLIFSTIGITTFLMIVPTGFISDKLGRKWAAAPAALFTTIAFVAFPLADNLVELNLVAVIVGLANGLALGAMTIYTYDIVPDHAKGQLQALRRTFGELGAMLSPPVSGLIAIAYGPSAAFWVFSPLHAVSAFLLFFVAKESLGQHIYDDEPVEREDSPS
jgi:MFS family permease